jgi:hypothetical protein
MKPFILGVGLVCILATQAIAGEIPSGGVPAPPPPGGTIPIVAAGPSDGCSLSGETWLEAIDEQLGNEVASALLGILNL